MRPVTDDDVGLKTLFPSVPGDGNVEGLVEYRPHRSTCLFINDTVHSIVAVHGLGAHPDDTWSKNRGTNNEPAWVNWLEEPDMLPAVVPTARIMRYGYKSGWFGQDSIKQTAGAVAQKLLVALRRKRKV